MNDYTVIITENKKVSADAYRMTLKTEKNLPEIIGGQFLQLAIPGRPDMPLRRPFCICQFHGRFISIYYAVVGKGTAVMAGMKKGTETKCALPLGNGFVLKDEYKNVALIGGGLGVAPLLPVIKSYPGKSFRAYLGYKSAVHIILKDEFAAACESVIATDDGSYGLRGFPTDALANDIKNGYKPDVLLVCGPKPMMKAARDIANAYNIDAYMTGEDRMGCGVGACLVCTCAVLDDGGEYQNLRSCADGPVFDLKKVKL